MLCSWCKTLVTPAHRGDLTLSLRQSRVARGRGSTSSWTTSRNQCVRLCSPVCHCNWDRDRAEGTEEVAVFLWSILSTKPISIFLNKKDHALRHVKRVLEDELLAIKNVWASFHLTHEEKKLSKTVQHKLSLEHSPAQCNGVQVFLYEPLSTQHTRDAYIMYICIVE